MWTYVLPVRVDRGSECSSRMKSLTPWTSFVLCVFLFTWTGSTEPSTTATKTATVSTRPPSVHSAQRARAVSSSNGDDSVGISTTLVTITMASTPGSTQEGSISSSSSSSPSKTPPAVLSFSTQLAPASSSDDNISSQTSFSKSQSSHSDLLTIASNATTSTIPLAATSGVNSTVSKPTSPPLSSTLTAPGFHEPCHCLPGSQCAWKLGVGLSFGSMCAITAFIVVSRTYKRHLEASQQEHHTNWSNRDHAAADFYHAQNDPTAMKLVDVQDFGTAASRKADELYLPDDSPSIADRVVGVKQQYTGSVKRKPLPSYYTRGT